MENELNEISNMVDIERVGDVAILNMVSVPHNLVSVKMTTALKTALKMAVEDKCRAIILSSGLRHFSAGADLVLFENKGAQFRSEFDAVGVLDAFEELPVPIVASVHGVALGGGFELALACDFIIASASAKFGAVECSLGLNPLMGGIQRLVQRAGVARAKEMTLLGRRHDAATLESWGVINKVVADTDLRQASLTIATELAAGPTLAHACTKRLINTYLRDGMKKADQAMDEIGTPIWTSEDLQRGLDAFQEKGPGHARFIGQ